MEKKFREIRRSKLLIVYWKIGIFDGCFSSRSNHFRPDKWLAVFSFRNKLEDICFQISCEHISEHFSNRNAGNLLSKQSQYNVTLARILGILWITVAFVSLSWVESSRFFPRRNTEDWTWRTTHVPRLGKGSLSPTCATTLNASFISNSISIRE